MQDSIKESIVFDSELRSAIKQTTEIFAKAVKGTLGPKGTNVGTLSQLKLPVVLNDGVTVAKNLNFKDPLSKYIANILKTVSQNTEKEVGDGTSTSITLAETIILEGLRNIEVGFSQVDVSKGIRLATIDLLKSLEEVKIDARTMLEEVATISANNDREIGKLVAQIFDKAGEDGKVNIENSYDSQTRVETIEGVKYDIGYESEVFSNTADKKTVFENTFVLLYEGELKSMHVILQLLQDINDANESLIIIADSYSEGALMDLINARRTNGLNICALRSPGYGQMKELNMDDLSLITGAPIQSNRFGRKLETLQKNDLLKVDKITVGKDTMVIENKNKDLTGVIAELKSKEKTETDPNVKSELKERISRLSEGVATLYVGGNSPMEISEKKYRIEDAIGATKSALEEGIVPGGGITLFRLGKSLEMPKMKNRAEEIGYQIVVLATEAPIRTILMNAGQKPDIIMSQILGDSNFNYGYNANTNSYVDMVEDGVIDPLKVTKSALTNASSVAQLLLTMNTCIYE